MRVRRVNIALSQRQITRVLAVIIAASSVLLCIIMAAFYAQRPDIATAATVFPAWVWVLLGVSLAGAAALCGAKRSALGVTGLWLFFLLLFAEEPRSLLRDWFSLTRQDRWAADQMVRVITFNCRGSAAALREVAVWRPDIVLVQEGLGREETQQVARLLCGTRAATLWNGDTAILARGALRPVPTPRLTGESVTHGQVRLPNGVWTDVVSLHLMPNLVRLDLWSTACWRAYAANRRARRDQLKSIVAHLRATVSADAPLIVGGDFNAPAGDSVFRLLTPWLHDTFATAGRGWGNTFHNDFPVIRIDQVWVSRHFRPLRVTAHPSRYSDHRFVICDLVVATRR